MIQICRKDKEKVYEAIRKGKIDAAEMSFPNLIDDIILTMKKHKLTEHLAQALPDKRRDNSHIPFDILLCLAVAAKLKRKTSLTDVPFAVTEAELLAELGWNLWDNERDVNEEILKVGLRLIQAAVPPLSVGSSIPDRLRHRNPL